MNMSQKIQDELSKLMVRHGRRVHPTHIVLGVSEAQSIMHSRETDRRFPSVLDGDGRPRGLTYFFEDFELPIVCIPTESHFSIGWSGQYMENAYIVQRTNSQPAPTGFI